MRPPPPVDRTGARRWPLVEDPADPWAMDWPDDDLGLADRRSAHWLPAVKAPADYQASARALQDYLDAWHRGAVAPDVRTLADVADAAGVSLDLRHDKRPVVDGPYRASVAALARLALDHEPHAGDLAPDAVLGPYALALSRRHGRAVRQHALAQWAACRTSHRPPVQALHTARPIPPPPVRAAARAVRDAPFLPWRVHREGPSWRLIPRLPLTPARIPAAPLSIVRVGVGDLGDGATVLARMVSTRGTWSVWAPLVLPGDPPDAVVLGWLAPELARVRLRNRRATVEDVLRGHGDRIALAAHLWAWTAA